MMLSFEKAAREIFDGVLGGKIEKCPLQQVMINI
jgi:hypothetical protein